MQGFTLVLLLLDPAITSRTTTAGPALGVPRSGMLCQSHSATTGYCGFFCLKAVVNCQVVFIPSLGKWCCTNNNLEIFSTRQEKKTKTYTKTNSDTAKVTYSLFYHEGHCENKRKQIFSMVME